MSANGFASEMLAIVRRNWVVMVVCVAAAAGTAAILTLGTSTTYEGRAVISVDEIAIAQNARLPKPDEVIARTGTIEFAERVAGEHGLDAQSVQRGLNAFSLGHPQDRIVVTYESTDRDEAEEVTRSGAEATVDEGFELAAPVIEHQRRLIEEASDTLAILEPLVAETPTVRFNVWSVRRNMFSDQQVLGFMESVFTYEGGVSVTERSRESALATSAIGGLIGGLAIAVLIIAVREVRARSRA